MKADVDAVKAALEAVPGLAGKVFVSFTTPVGTVVNPPYVLIHPSAGTDTADRLTGPNQIQNPQFTLHLVGANPESTQIVFDNVKTAFVQGGIMTPPVVAGRRNSAGYFRNPLPIQISDAVTPPMTYAVVELGWQSEAA